MNWRNLLHSRPVIFFLAWLSFACLFGQFYGLWSMKTFALVVFPPATILLILAAVTSPGTRAEDGPRTWIVEGAVGGIVAAVAYDLYRLPFVLNGAPLFKVFALFGKYLTGKPGPHSLWEAVGWTYHFSNGAALGIMFLAMVPSRQRAVLFWGAVGWALFVETVLLLTPYAKFFGLALNGKFIFYTASAHAIFGVALGVWTALRLGRPRTPPISTAA